MNDKPEASKIRISVQHPSLKIVLTELRSTDAPAVISGLNDPRVYMNLTGPPYPYTQKDWNDWYPVQAAASEQVSAELKAIRESVKTTSGSSENWWERKWVGKTHWTSTIRHVVESEADTEENFIGEISIVRSGFVHILDRHEREKRIQENVQREAGDPAIVWEVGFHLVPEYHARGIMVAALRTLMTDVLVPYMNVHCLLGTYFEHNRASRRVFEQCGFTYVTTVPDAVAIDLAKVGGAEDTKVGLGLNKWVRGEPIVASRE